MTKTQHTFCMVKIGYNFIKQASVCVTVCSLSASVPGVTHLMLCEYGLHPSHHYLRKRRLPLALFVTQAIVIVQLLNCSCSKVHNSNTWGEIHTEMKCLKLGLDDGVGCLKARKQFTKFLPTLLRCTRSSRLGLSNFKLAGGHIPHGLYQCGVYTIGVALVGVSYACWWMLPYPTCIVCAQVFPHLTALCMRGCFPHPVAHMCRQALICIVQHPASPSSLRKLSMAPCYTVY